ncbi:peptidase S15 [Pseudovirgaria hyperparasitica]|uniref:Peptidase S15 n=1 Tax=Pseudovirgaria hyperparasitica TaxID=470096 RepID=A0A6A6WLK5_9PEZI|nr:peptidase S15 [Pseudovirgaria hyperparasitica]KAF2763052.1 peptidase S15 [Pseudovirgaria hyperparasitica]
MAAEQERRDVEFKTFDGLTLRGWLFVGPKGGPAVIVNGAFMCPREIFVANIAAWFGRHGLTALVYDARSIGASDGMPRTDLDPQKMAEDNSDAVTFLQNDGWVDPNRIAVWGFFYSSGIALEAAAFDRRIKAVIAQGLMPEWYLDPKDQEDLVARAVEDRANQLRGEPPAYMPLLNEKGEHFLLFNYLAKMTPEQQAHLPNWIVGAKKAASTFRDSLTIQSFYRHAKWKPIHLFASVSPTPVMILTPENDEIVPPEYQKSIYDSLQSPQKRFQIVKDRGHANFLSVDIDELLTGQLAFLKDVLGF